MTWRPILHARASTATAQRSGGGTVEQAGWIVGWPDTAFPTVEVALFPSGERREVHMPWADRPSLFDTFVRRSAGVARYSVSLRHDAVQRYTLWIDEAAIRRQLEERGHVDGEVALVALLHRLAAEGQLSDDAACFTLPAALRERHDEPTRLDDLAARLHARGWPEATPPYPGQLKSIAWLRAVERAVVEEQDIEYEAGVPLGSSGWSYRVTQDQLRPSAHSGLGSARIRGGCCCDAVGTGKTASALGLVLLSDPLPPTQKDAIRVRTPATLVVVPTNLPQQWASEAARFAPALKVALLLGLKDMKALSMRSLLDADLVVSTFAFLRGKPYLDALDEHTLQVAGRQGARARDAGVLCTCARVLTHANALEEVPPLLELLRWRRLVVDEMHEVLQSPRDLRVLRSFSVDAVVGLTGTPDTSCGEAVQAFYPMVLRPTRTDEDPHHHVCLQAAVEHGLMCQHDRMETAPRHVVVRVRLDAVERTLLETCGDALAAADAAMLGCGVWGAPDAAQRVGRDEVAAAVAEWHAVRARELADGAAREEQERRHAFVLRRLPELADGAQCSICIDRGVDTLLLECGHLLCAACAERAAKAHCPFCRGAVARSVRVAPTGGGFGSRVDAACELLTRLRARGEGVLAFTQFRPLLANLDAALAAAGVRAAVLEGSTARRASCVRRFRDRELDALLLCFERSISGLNLSEARHVVLLHALTGQPHEVAAMEEQAVGRAHRRGQTGQVTVHHLLGEDTAEEVRWRQSHEALG